MANVDTDKLLNEMTLEEKIGQLMQLAPRFFKDSARGEITGPIENSGLSLETIMLAGSVLGIGSAKEMREIQNKYLENSDKKIPLLFMADIIHGYRTVFPVPLALGCSWDTDVVKEAAGISALEASAGGVHVTFSPMVDLVRDARWGRVVESTGEDPYLNSLFSRAFVKGYQGDDIKKHGNIAACVKHFAAYGAPEGGREYNTVDISERILKEFYLPAYKAAIDEGCKMVMTAFNTVDSIPASGNKKLLRDILRDEWNFSGVVISDHSSVGELVPHGVAEDKKEAAKKCIEAGLDIEMMTSCYVKHLKELIEEGTISESLIDESVLRILNLKADLGLFENPYKGADQEKGKKIILSKAHRKAARDAAAKSMVLFKNDNVLPMDKSVKKVAVIGPYADNHSINGPWSWQGKNEETISVLDGIVNKIGKDKVVTASGCGIEDGTEEEINNAVMVCEDADIIILALGEDQSMSGEGGSRAFIKLPGRQEELANEIFALGKPTVVTLFNGRPLEIKDLYDNAPAILETWFPGTEGGNAIADILFGDINPSGRLSMSFPYTVGQIPVYYNSFNTGRPKDSEAHKSRYNTHYLDIPNTPLLPFGFGLSYTSYSYSDFKLNKNELTEDGEITASVKIKNTGKVSGCETVQLYIRDISADVVRPVMELKDFKKVYLKPNEEEEVSFNINEDMLKYYNNKNEFKADKGSFTIMAGPNSKEVSKLNFNTL